MKDEKFKDLMKHGSVETSEDFMEKLMDRIEIENEREMKTISELPDFSKLVRLTMVGLVLMVGGVVLLNFDLPKFLTFTQGFRFSKILLLISLSSSMLVALNYWINLNKLRLRL